ncbi:hypothetical protein MMC20_006192 [Loxospora ochrophaea]|nr:hypothetical protein [Loxospora ochrophaea]
MLWTFRNQLHHTLSIKGSSSPYYFAVPLNKSIFKHYGAGTASRTTKNAVRHKVRQVELVGPTQKSTDLYTYAAIPEHDSKIRILELLGGNGVDVYCYMHTANLEGSHPLMINRKHQTFEALSYTWHDQSLSEVIVCEGKTLNITAGLYDALVSLRQPSASRWIWIDQTCINQADVQERSEQVKSMRLIYNRASLVVVWRGKEDEFTSTAFRLIDTIFTKHVSADDSLMADHEAIWDRHVMDTMGLPPFPSFDWESLARLFERD